ncbi:DUF480 domain-containing protein [Klebsiella quasipneumoniae]|uniref:DUF480 domain-containing protein n=1 Tax=Klebsiella quasipneumoniae TaxID=1463165 RepID=UPI00384CD973
MEIVLGPLEARVIGCLIEKEICTPDQYPLSLNALVNACNQKSNREPVLELAELDIRAVIDELIRRRLVVNTAGFNARVPRYQHPGLTHQCLYFEQPHTFEQILFIQTAEPALVGHA